MHESMYLILLSSTLIHNETAKDLNQFLLNAVSKNVLLLVFLMSFQACENVMHNSRMLMKIRDQ